MNASKSLRQSCALVLRKKKDQIGPLRAVLGFDGFVDEIVDVVDKRENATNYQPLPSIRSFVERVSDAIGKSTNLELVGQRIKLGGNGPILANAMARLGLTVDYLGAVGDGQVHPVFQEFSAIANLHCLANPAHTHALEFEDGKLMLCNTTPLNEVNWERMMERIGVDGLVRLLDRADFLGFVNWTMIPFMSQIWKHLLDEVFPLLSDKRRWLFVDLADPEKRLNRDILDALELMRRFQSHVQVVFGLNEKESSEVGQVMGLPVPKGNADSLIELADSIRSKLGIHSVVIHPVRFAVSAQDSRTAMVEGPYEPHPLITTGAGDHFNAGYCLGHLLGMELEGCLLLGVATSGFYVRTGVSPNQDDLIEFLEHWPGEVA